MRDIKSSSACNGYETNLDIKLIFILFFALARPRNTMLVMACGDG